MLSLTSAVAVALLLSIAHATSPLDVDIGLYHASSHQVGATGCTSPRLPYNLCTKCVLKPFTGTGPNLNFSGVNRFDIYELNDEAGQCRVMLERYVKWNPCDTIRANAVKNYFDPTKPWHKVNAYKTLIYFMYSVCETCCDCIPIGSKIETYDEQKQNGTLVNIARGNCAAHMHYDTCKIWPNAGEVRSPRGNETQYTPWCDDFKTWQFSPDAKGWLKNNKVNGLTPAMRRGMRMLMWKTNCRHKATWQNCVRMEKAQRRV